MAYIITLSVLVLLLAAFLVFLYVIFSITFAPLKRVVNNPRRIPKTDQYDKVKEELLSLVDELEKESFEEITIKSHDGLTLFARYYDRGNNDTIEIDFHGYRGHAIRDFCGGSSIARKDGRSSIIVDERSHTNSGGKAITFGIKERLDLALWVNYAVERFGKDVKIILSGVSMGGATVLMASELDLPKNVVGILADCPYTSPKEIICKVARDRKLRDRFFYPFIKLSAKIFAKVNIEEASAIDAVTKTNIPILIVHGNDDRFVPYEMGKRLYEACASENKRFLTVDGAGHAISFFCDRELYEKTVREFLDSIL